MAGGPGGTETPTSSPTLMLHHSWDLVNKQEAKRMSWLGMVWALETSDLTLRDTPPSTQSRLMLPKRFQQMGVNYLKPQVCRGHSHPNYQSSWHIWPLDCQWSSRGGGSGRENYWIFGLCLLTGPCATFLVGSAHQIVRKAHRHRPCDI